MRKTQILEHWRNLAPNQALQVTPVPYKHKGSTYAQDTIRLTGSKEFIDSVLSRIKELINHEDDRTRLQLVYKESVDRETDQPMGTFNAYIQIHQRGGA